MEYARHTNALPFDQLDELFDTVRFSLETVRMALSIGRRASDPFLTLDGRARSQDPEEREAGAVALEALEHAGAAFRDLAEFFCDDQFEAMGMQMGFWAHFEWTRNRLFCASARTTGQATLRHELVEASNRALDLQHDLHELRDDRLYIH